MVHAKVTVNCTSLAGGDEVWWWLMISVHVAEALFNQIKELFFRMLAADVNGSHRLWWYGGSAREGNCAGRPIT